MAFRHRHAAQNEIRYEAKFVPKIEKERGRKIAVFFPVNQARRLRIFWA
jgi:hypothetical protein